MLRNLFVNSIKRFYSVENLVQKPVGEHDKTRPYQNALNSSAKSIIHSSEHILMRALRTSLHKKIFNVIFIVIRHL